MEAIKEYSAPAEPQSYVWSFPGAPIRIHLALAVVQGLEPRFRRDAAAQCGLLLGHVDGLATVVSGFQPLATVDGSEIKSALADLAASSDGPSAVGYYRAQRPEGLRLNEKDIALAGAFFRDPHNVILLVHQADPGPANATFFFWDGGRLNGDFPFLEFPFESEPLAMAEQHRVEAAQRRAFEIPVAVEAPAVPAAIVRPRRHVFWKGLAWAFLGACLGGAVIGMRFFPEKFRWPLPAFEPAASAVSAASTVAPPAQRPSMGLHAERQSGDLKLTWNREAAVISNATSAVLSIEDGDSHRTIPLQANQVRAGSILYTPVSDQVQMELAVSTPADHVTESVLVLLPKTGPPQTLAARPPVHTPPPPAPAPAPASESASRFQQAKQFIPPPEPSRGPSPAISLSEPPAVASASSAPPVSMPLWSHPLVAPPPIVKPAPQAPRPAPVVEPTYYQPETVSQVRPNFPLALKNIIVKPTAVEVVVAIDETGKVVKANVKPQLGLNPLLISASASAAKQWRFRPARQGNQPVASEMLLRFTFSPNP